MDDATRAMLQERRWSFVSRTGSGLFVKVPKAAPGRTLSEAIVGAAEIELARREHDALNALAAVPHPRVRCSRTISLSQHEAVLWLADEGDLTPLESRLRGEPAAWADDLRALGEWLRAVHLRYPGQVTTGFGLENVAIDHEGRILVFDPNEMRSGNPEEDLARFCVSLLRRGFNRLRLPNSASTVHCMAFLSGYGRDGVDPDRFMTFASQWHIRHMDEMRVAIRWRAGRAALALLEPWLWRYSRLLRAKLGRVRSVVYPLPVEELDSKRYATRAAASVYQRQQGRFSLRYIRLQLLARLEVRAVARALRGVDGAQRILDVPGGTGKLWPLFERLHLQTLSGDLSPAMLNEAPRSPSVHQALMDITKLPVRSNSVDAVVCLRLLHRLPQYRRVLALSELQRASLGLVVVSFASSDGILGVRYRLVSALRRSTSWAPHPINRLEIALELHLAGLKFSGFRRIAGIASNEILVVARVQI